MMSTVTTKGQVTIPKEIRDQLQIRTNDKVDFIVEGERVVLVPVRTLLDLRGVVPPLEKGGTGAERERAKAAVAERVLEEME